MEPTILNAGLQLAMEFGANWLQPIQARLGAQFPHLSSVELDEYERVCRTAMTDGHAQAREHMQAAARDQEPAFRSFSSAMLAAYPWLDTDALSHLFSQGCYYAWKDGAL